MAQTLPNGVVVPQQSEAISAAGVQEMRTLGASVDAILAGKLEDADLDPLRAASFNRGVLPANTDTRTYVTEAHSGMWHIRSQAAAEGMIGLPEGLQVQGEFLVLAGGPATQMFFPYGFYGAGPQVRHVVNVATNELSDWSALGGSSGAGAAGGPWVQNHIRKTQFVQAMGGPIDTGGLGAVALRFDHGLTNFRDKVLPLTKARGLKVSQAYNPRNWHYDENAGVTATQLNSWVADGDVEIWNHSANHLDASDDDALYDTIVNGLVEIEAELPAARGKVFGFNPPGVDTTNGYGGFGNGNSPEKWDTPAGRIILQHHAVASAYLPGTSIRPLDGTVRDGQSHITMDSISVATIKGYIDQAITQRGGLQLMLHPSQLDTAGKLTTAQLTEVLDYLVQKRTDGELVTLSPYQMAVADATAYLSGAITHEWAGTPHESESIKRIGGVEVARNRAINPSLETSSSYGLMVGSEVNTSSRTTVASRVFTGEYSGILSWIDDGSTAEVQGIVQQETDALPGQWVALSVYVSTTATGVLYVAGQFSERTDTNNHITHHSLGEYAPAGQNSVTRFTYVVQVNDESTRRVRAGLRFSSTPGSYSLPQGYGYTDGWHIAVADTEAEAVNQVADYFDGDTPTVDRLARLEQRIASLEASLGE